MQHVIQSYCNVWRSVSNQDVGKISWDDQADSDTRRKKLLSHLNIDPKKLIWALLRLRSFLPPKEPEQGTLLNLEVPLYLTGNDRNIQIMSS